MRNHKSRDYKLGDYAWFYCGNHEGIKTRGQIVHTFKKNGRTQFVLAVPVPTLGEETLHVRESIGLSPHKNKPIGLFEKLKNLQNK